MGLGDTDVDPESTPFHMEAQAEMLEEFMRALGHESFSIVCHDQGGAAAQLIAAQRPKLLRSLVLTDCVCYDNWPVPLVAHLQTLFRVPHAADLAITAGLFKANRVAGPLFRTGVHDKGSLSDEAIDEYLRPLHESSRSRARLGKFLLAGSPTPTLRAVPGLKRFDKPSLVVWAADDRHISPSWGHKLAEDIPGVVDFKLVPFCGHFWQEERPSEFVSHIGPFLAQHAGHEANHA
jgi:pimeloyl-ACP methyl ester carboxylesterase